MWENYLIKKLRIIANFITSPTGKRIITIYILLSISSSEDKQTMKFAQLTEYDMRNIFLEK